MDKELPVSAWPEWKIIEKIGEGSFGKVYKAQRTERGKSSTENNSGSRLIMYGNCIISIFHIKQSYSIRRT